MPLLSTAFIAVILFNYTTLNYASQLLCVFFALFMAFIAVMSYNLFER